MNKFLYRLFCLVYAVQQGATRRFTPIGWGVLGFLALSALVGLDTRQTVAYQIFALLLAMLLIAIVYSLRFRYRFTARRHLPRFATVGSRLQYSVVIYNHTNKKQPGLKLLETFADPRPNYREFQQIMRAERKKHRFVSLSLMYYQWLKAIALKQKATAKTTDIPTLLPNGKTKIVVKIEPTHRGVMRLSGVTVARPDPFGIFYGFRTVSLPQSLLILPKRYELPPLQLLGGRTAQTGGVALTTSVGDSEEFMSLRDYRPGDPLRKIHWRSWAKTDKPIIKEEQHEYFVRQALILDTFQTAQSEILEEAIAVAASFAMDFRTQESLLDLMFVEQEAYNFTAGRGLENAEKMLAILAGVTACRDRTFDYLTQTVMSKILMLSGCVCIFVAWDRERKKLVDYLRQANIPILVLIITDSVTTSSNYYGADIHSLKVGQIQEDLLVKLGTSF